LGSKNIKEISQNLDDLWIIVRKLLHHFNVSTQGHHKLMLLQKELILESNPSGQKNDGKIILMNEPKAMPTLCETRWLGVYNASGVLSLPIVRNATQSYISGCSSDFMFENDGESCTVQHIRLSKPQWDQLTDIRCLTYPFSVLSSFFQGETYVNSSYYIYLIEWLKLQMSGTSADLKWIDALGNKLGIRSDDMSDFARLVQSRLRDWLKKKLLEQKKGQCAYSKEDLISALLDPRLKSFAFEGMDAFKGEAIIALKNEVLLYATAAEANTVILDHESVEQVVIPPVQQVLDDEDDDVFACMSKAADLKSPTVPVAVAAASPAADLNILIHTKAELEVDKWLSMDVCERSLTLKTNHRKSPMAMLQLFNPLDFWHELRSELPLLYLVACRHLAAPCAESFAERMFSSGGALDGKCSVETVECRIQMRINSRLLEKNIGIIRKVPVDGGIQYFLNLDYAKNSTETEEFADFSSDEDDDIATEES